MIEFISHTPNRLDIGCSFGIISQLLPKLFHLTSHSIIHVDWTLISPNRQINLLFCIYPTGCPARNDRISNSFLRRTIKLASMCTCLLFKSIRILSNLKTASPCLAVHPSCLLHCPQPFHYTSLIKEM